MRARSLLFALALVALPMLFGQAGGPRAATQAPAANVYVSPSGNDQGSGCRRLSPAAAAPEAPVCASVARALALAQPGDVVQLLPGDYGALTISRQAGVDEPKVVVRGDPGQIAEAACRQDCMPGNVIVHSLTVCGHGLSIRNLDSSGVYDYFYVGDNSCPGGNEVDANHDIELVNIHFNAGTLRGRRLLLSGSRIGPNVGLCDAPAAREDNLHVWPDARTEPWTVPSDVTIRGNFIYGAEMPPTGCGGAHADLIQTLGYDNLTIEDNVFWHCAHSFIQDGTRNGTGFSGTVVIRNNTFAYCVANGGGYTHLGSVDGSGPCTASYLIENNTWTTGATVVLQCPQSAGTIWRGNYTHVSAQTATTCGSGTWDHNVFDPGSATCGDAARVCRPTWLQDGAGGDDPLHGPDLHVARTDTCLRGAGAPGDGTQVSRDIDGDMRPLRAAPDAGADQWESAEILLGRSIGEVRLGMTRAAVEAVYGQTHATSARRLAKTRPRVLVATYRFRGRSLWVAYAGDQVVGVGTASPYYTTATGAGVGVQQRNTPALAHARWLKCRSAYALTSAGAVTSFAARANGTIRAVSVIRSSFGGPAICPA